MLISGPCSVESEEQIVSIAHDLKKSGATFLRGGAYKPRTSPTASRDLGEGLELLKTAGKGRASIVSELMSTEVLDRFVEDVDIIRWVQETCRISSCFVSLAGRRNQFFLSEVFRLPSRNG